MKEAIERGPGWALTTVFTVAMIIPLVGLVLSTTAIPDSSTPQEVSAMLAMLMASTPMNVFGWAMFMVLSMLKLQGPPEPNTPDPALAPKAQMLWVLGQSNARWQGLWADFQAQLRRLKTLPTKLTPGTLQTSITLQGRLAVRGQWLRIGDCRAEGTPLPLQTALEGQTTDGMVIDAPDWAITPDALVWSRTLMDNPAVRQALDALWTHRPGADAMRVEFTPMYVRVTFESRKAAAADPNQPEAWLEALVTLFKAAQALEGCHDTPTIEELEEADPTNKPHSRVWLWFIAIAVWLFTTSVTLVWVLWFVGFVVLGGIQRMNLPQ